MDNRETEFAVFCIENSASACNKSGSEIYQELNRTDGIRKFLYPSYAALHTQGKDYITSEVLDYIRQYNPDFLKTN